MKSENKLALGILMIVIWGALNLLMYGLATLSVFWNADDICSSAHSIFIVAGFSNLAFIFACIEIFSSKEKQFEIWQISIKYIAVQYFILQYIIGICICFWLSSTFWTIVAEVLLSAFFLIRYVLHRLANEHTELRVNSQQIGNDILKQELALVKSIELKITDTQAQNKVQKLYEVLQSTPIANIVHNNTANSTVEQMISRLEMTLKEDPDSVLRAINEAIVAAEQRKLNTFLTTG